MGGPSIEFKQPEKFLGVSTPVEVLIGAPAPQLKALGSSSNRTAKAFRCYSLGDRGRGRQGRRGRPASRHARRRQGDRPRAQVRDGADPGHRIAAGSLRPSHRRHDGFQGRSGAARAAARLRRVGPPLRQPWRGRVGRLPRLARRRQVRRARRGRRVSGLSGKSAGLPGIKITDPALRVAFFALRHDQDLKTPIRVFARDEAGTRRARTSTSASSRSLSRRAGSSWTIASWTASFRQSSRGHAM